MTKLIALLACLSAPEAFAWHGPHRVWVPGHFASFYQPNCPPGGPGMFRCHSGRMVHRWIPGHWD